MNVQVYDPHDKRTPAEKIKSKYEYAPVTPATVVNLKNELLQLVMQDQLERKLTPEREEAKELIKAYLEYVESVGK